MDTIVLVLEGLRRRGAAAGPYVAVEMILPGGTLLALLLYLYRRRRAAVKPAALPPGPAQA